jgi:hypothetical protein
MADKRMQSMVRFCNSVVKLNPSYFAFLSGASISISTNLLTGLIFTGVAGKLVALAWWVTGASFIASVAWAALALHIEGPHRHWVVYWRDTKDHLDLKEEDVMRGGIGNKANLIAVDLVIGSIASIVSIGLLIFSAVIR